MASGQACIDCKIIGDCEQADGREYFSESIPCILKILLKMFLFIEKLRIFAVFKPQAFS